MRTSAALTSLAVIIQGAVLLPSFAPAGNPSQDLLEVMQYQQSQEVQNDQRLFRPSPQEREAVNNLIDMKPRPKTFNDADIRYLKGVRDKAAWLGAERRIMHQMWTDATRKQWGAGDADSPKQPQSAQ